MSLNTNKKQSGFTLVELLITMAILSIISVISVRLLWDTLSVRSTQYSIEHSSENFRRVITTISEAIQSASHINVLDAETLEITGEPCRTFRINTTTKALEQAIDDSASCSPPSAGFSQITQDEITLDIFEFSPVGERPYTVRIDIEGIYSDGAGDHPFTYYTSITSRITL